MSQFIVISLLGSYIHGHQPTINEIIQIDMSLQSILNSEFFTRSLQINKEIKFSNLKTVSFPLKRFITQGDDFFKHLWKCIDRSQSYVWILSYAFDHSIPANTTIIKLIEARKRGVHTVLFVDDLQQHLDKDLLNQYIAVGGVFNSLNPFFTKQILKKLLSKELFRRHHQKLFVSDNCGIIGSANIESGYASTKYGSRVFKDLCYYSENLLVEEYRNYFLKIANYYQISLSHHHTNDNLLAKFHALYPNSEFYRKSNYKLLRSQQPEFREIQTEVLKKLSEAKKSITIVQPYYYPIKQFETEISKALERGVKVELITGAKRDQPVYKWLKNGLMLRRLIKQGLSVYEMHEKILHSKTYIIDQNKITMGSFNNDRWSWKISNEVNISIESRADYQHLLPFIQKLKVDCIKVSKRPFVSWVLYLRLRFWERFLYLSECLMSKEKEFKINEFLFDSTSDTGGRE